MEFRLVLLPLLLALPPSASVTAQNPGTAGAGLPNDAGQVWREYDLRAFTSQITDTDRPQQAVVDWILRETGTDLWFSEPLGILSASHTKLRVYHTPQVQAVVEDIVSRFAGRARGQHAFGLRVIFVGNGNWRARLHHLLEPIETQSPATEAWLTPKENAALVAEGLVSRMDAQELGSPELTLLNGQTYRERQQRPVTYTRMGDTRAARRGVVTVPQQLEEGFTFEFTPLLHQDLRSVDAVLKFDAVQVERLDSVWINVAGSVDARNRTQIQIPRLSACRVHERFRWPANRVLIASTGVVPRPAQVGGPALFTLPLLPKTPERGEAVVLIDYRGPQGAQADGRTARLGGVNNRGRY